MPLFRQSVFLAFFKLGASGWCSKSISFKSQDSPKQMQTCILWMCIMQVYIFDLVTSTIFVISGKKCSHCWWAATFSLRCMSQIVQTIQALTPPISLCWLESLSRPAAANVKVRFIGIWCEVRSISLKECNRGQLYSASHSQLFGSE